MTTTRTTTLEASGHRPTPPVLRDGKTLCPRCSARLNRDYEGLTCVACGYEFTVAPGDLEWGRLLRPRRAAAAFLPLVLLRVSPMVVVAAIALLAAGELIRALRRRSLHES
jgi:hypothetical protein